MLWESAPALDMGYRTELSRPGGLSHKRYSHRLVKANLIKRWKGD